MLGKGTTVQLQTYVNEYLLISAMTFTFNLTEKQSHTKYVYEYITDTFTDIISSLCQSELRVTMHQTEINK